jgi:hypothetical protein
VLIPPLHRVGNLIKKKYIILYINKNPLHLSMCCKIFYYQALKCCNSIMYHSCIHFLQSDRHKSIIKYTTAYASIYCAIISVSLSQGIRKLSVSAIIVVEKTQNVPLRVNYSRIIIKTILFTRHG